MLWVQLHSKTSDATPCVDVVSAKPPESSALASVLSNDRSSAFGLLAFLAWPSAVGMGTRRALILFEILAVVSNALDADGSSGRIGP